MSQQQSEMIPRGDLQGFTRYIKEDFVAGLMVFIIALPLCLAISLASGFPPMAGIITAVVGSLLATFISNSELTIKGPAAGLIVIVLGCIKDFGGNGFADGQITAEDINAYRSALAVATVASVLQILFGLFKAGILSEFFPKSAIHGMLSAIGVIIIAKQIPIALGVKTDLQEPFELLGEIPHFLTEANPAIAGIGLVSLTVLATWPWLKKRLRAVSAIPPQLVVLIVAVLIGLYFNLLHKHNYNLLGHEYELSESHLVPLPQEMFGIFKQVVTPEFGALTNWMAWKWVLMFFVIGTLESILSAKAIDAIDPWKRKTDMNRDVLAVGFANLAASLLGGLPMISEIVRSKANIDNGAKTRFADLWHGVLLLLCVSLLPSTLHLIPKAALAAMLIYTGYRLAHPSEFMHAYHVGREQLIIFVTTLLVTLWTDLLFGVAAGIGMKFFIHILNGVPMKSFFKAYLDIEPVSEDTVKIRASESAVFSNWIPFKRQIEHIGLVQRNNLVVDISDAKLVDHTVMEKLHEMQAEMEAEGLRLEIVGLEQHQALSEHGDAARKRGLTRMRRITVIAEPACESLVQRECIERGATGFTVTPAQGVGRHNIHDGTWDASPSVRIETIVPFHVSEGLIKFLRDEIIRKYHATVSIETVEVLSPSQFVEESQASGVLVAADH